MGLYSSVNVGACWGSLELVKEWCEPKLYQGPKGMYHGGDYGPDLWRLRCDCGHEFVIEKIKFPGKRRMRNCNWDGSRPECTAWQAERVKPERRLELGRPRKEAGDLSLSLSISLPISMVQLIDRKAVDGDKNRSRVILEMLKIAVDNQPKKE